MTTQTFNPVDYNFRWTEDWYEFDSVAATLAAKKARDNEARQLRSEGLSIKCESFRNQFITRGGVGSGHPEVNFLVTVYTVSW